MRPGSTHCCCPPPRAPRARPCLGVQRPLGEHRAGHHRPGGGSGTGKDWSGSDCQGLVPGTWAPIKSMLLLATWPRQTAGRAGLEPPADPRAPGFRLGAARSSRPLPGFHQHVTSRQGTHRGRVGNTSQRPLGKGSLPLWGQQTGVRGPPPCFMYRISLAAPAPWGDTCLRPGLGNLGEAQKGGERHQATGRGPAPGRTPGTA